MRYSDLSSYIKNDPVANLTVLTEKTEFKGITDLVYLSHKYFLADVPTGSSMTQINAPQKHIVPAYFEPLKELTGTSIPRNSLMRAANYETIKQAIPFAGLDFQIPIHPGQDQFHLLEELGLVPSTTRKEKGHSAYLIDAKTYLDAHRQSFLN